MHKDHRDEVRDDMAWRRPAGAVSQPWPADPETSKSSSCIIGIPVNVSANAADGSFSRGDLFTRDRDGLLIPGQVNFKRSRQWDAS